MTHSSHWICHNRLLATLPDAELAFLQSHMEPVALRVHEVLETPGQAIPFVYFPQSGLVSVVATFGGCRAVEVGLLGLDRMTGTALAQYDDQSPYESVVQIAGQAVRVPASHFLEALTQRPAMRSCSAATLAPLPFRHPIRPWPMAGLGWRSRLARWLLMVHNRVAGDRIALTHEYMAIMLGVRRPGVTVALHILEGKGVIRSNRGEVVIRDRARLAAEAGGGYGQPEAEYSRGTGITLRKRTDGSVASSAGINLPLL